MPSAGASPATGCGPADRPRGRLKPTRSRRAEAALAATPSGAKARYAGAMKSGVFNLGFGLVAVALGATKEFTLLGTDSSTLLMVAGGAVAAFGVFQLWRNRGK